jgi:hypothetical protein
MFLLAPWLLAGFPAKKLKDILQFPRPEIKGEKLGVRG